jgi:hypothetical protein
VGLFLVTRGLGGEDTTVPPNPAPAKTSPAKPGASETNSAKPGKSQSQDGSQTSQSAAKPSKEAYINCVTQATDAAALEKCQALVP